MTKVISQAGLTKLIQLIKDGFLSKTDTVDANTVLSGYVPTSRTVNGKSLSSNISLSASDVGALPDSTVIPTVDQTYNSSSTNAQSGTAIASAITNMQTTSNLVTSVSSSSTDSQYPSAKLFYDTCGDIETLINAL